MQAVFLISLFTFVITLMIAIMTSGTDSAAMLTDQRIAETNRYFEQMARVIREDITQANMTGNPDGYTTVTNYIQNTSEVAAMSNGQSGNAIWDAWGRPIRGAILTRYESFSAASDTNMRLNVPVTAFAFVSAGPDGILQTTIPASPSTLLEVINIMAPKDASGKPTSDDIVFTFDNRKEMMDILDTLKQRVERIAVAVLKKHQAATVGYRQGLVNTYNAAIGRGEAATAPNMDLTHDSLAPKLMTLNNKDDRKILGVDEEFAILQRVLPNNGRLVVTSNDPVVYGDNLEITITNSTAQPTPLGPGTSFRYRLIVRPDRPVR